MRKYTTLLAALALGLAYTPVPAHAQTRTLVVPLFTDYDLDTPAEGTDADQILESVDLEADTTFTLDSTDPGDCRELTVTVTDTTDTIDTGDVTVTGTDCEGDTIVWVIDVSGHGGGAVVYNSLDPAESGREDYYFSAVTSIVSSADLATLGGSSDETIVAGVLVDTSKPISCVTYGGRHDDLHVEGSWIQGNAKVETSGASNTVTGVTASEDAFLYVDAGDELLIVNHDSSINSQDTNLRRVVATNANDDTVTVNDPDLDLDDTSTGYNYFYRERVCSQSDDEGWVTVSGAEQVSALVNVERYDVDSEDGIELRLQCKLDGADAIIEDITVTDVTAVGVYPFNTSASYDFCRITMLLDSFDSGTDTGAEIENLDGVMSVRYSNP
jgi:hypothetical protein